MKQSNKNRSDSQRKRSEKNNERIAKKPHISKHQKWEMRERLKIISEAYLNFTK